MTLFRRRMLKDDEEDSPAKCRQRRRRRIEMRRLAVLSAASSPSLDSQGRRENREESPSVSEEKRVCTGVTYTCSGNEVEHREEAPAREPVFGTMSVAGRSREMEDAIAARTWLCRPEICRRRPVHFFAVYDGHGGPHVKNPNQF